MKLTFRVQQKTSETTSQPVSDWLPESEAYLRAERLSREYPFNRYAVTELVFRAYYGPLGAPAARLRE